MPDREQWLNGWPRNESAVIIGTGVHCAGCGKSSGITCVDIPEDWTPPEKLPDWPFEEETCPVCQLRTMAAMERVLGSPAVLSTIVDVMPKKGGHCTDARAVQRTDGTVIGKHPI